MFYHVCIYETIFKNMNISLSFKEVKWMIFCKTFHFDNRALLGLDSLSGSTFHISSIVLVLEI